MNESISISIDDLPGPNHGFALLGFVQNDAT